MRKITTLVLMAIVALGALPVFDGVAQPAPTATVKVGDFFFKPSHKTVRRGTKVRFEWIGNNSHNVVKTGGPGGRFRSRTTSRRGVNFVKRFTKRGTYRLICTIHPWMQIRLKVR
ncbi:MAG TPA: plastocyanin/azurin family copper-binding protein [Solirubrobacterales bacterium]